jgi:putative NADH-flavin reductase
MQVVIFGATGRTGRAAVEHAVTAGHQVRAAVRHVPDPSPFDPAVTFAVADVLAPETVRAAIAGADAVIVAVGGDVFKPSEIVTQSAHAIVSAMEAAGVRRYIGISGEAQMRPTGTGHIAQAALRVSPIRYAVADHQGAYDIVSASSLAWTLAGCPWIKDDAHPGRYRLHPDTFPGGFHTIAPADVGAFLASQIADRTYERRIVGIW